MCHNSQVLQSHPPCGKSDGMDIAAVEAILNGKIPGSLFIDFHLVYKEYCISIWEHFLLVNPNFDTSRFVPPEFSIPKSNQNMGTCDIISAPCRYMTRNQHTKDQLATDSLNEGWIHELLRPNLVDFVSGMPNRTLILTFEHSSCYLLSPGITRLYAWFLDVEDLKTLGWCRLNCC